MSVPSKAIGIDIGGTKIAMAVVDEGGRIAASSTFATEAERGFDAALARMIDSADRILTAAGASRADLCGLGVGCTGPVSAQRGIINNPYTLPTWVECDIVSALASEFDRPAYLENDADAAALGEFFAGAARGARRMVMLTLGTGVGGGVVIDGRVYRGTRGEHPELGHIPIDPNGPACYCGANGCLESIASGTAITAAGRELGLGDSREVFARAAAGDAAASGILARVRAALATATWTVLHTFMPELIVLGGGIADDHYEALVDAMEQRIPLATMVPAGGTRVVKAALGNDAGMLGAASLALGRAKIGKASD
ncbi:MAG: ROK family protein [Pirellulales bacterium]